MKKQRCTVPGQTTIFLYVRSRKRIDRKLRQRARRSK